MNATRRSPVPLPLKEFLRDPEIAAELAALRTPSTARFLLAVAFNYLVISAAIVAVTQLAGTPALYWLAIVVYPIALVLIAARQHALLVLMHEGAHSSISRNRWLNDTLSDLLCGALLLVSTRSYRKDHLRHHQHLNSAADPDWTRKVDHPTNRAQWIFPTQVPLWRLLTQLYRYSVTYLLRSLADNRAVGAAADPTATSQPTNNDTGSPTDVVLKRSKYALYAGVVTTGMLLTSPATFLLGLLGFWLAPMLLVLPLIMRVRSIAEHFALPHNQELNQTRSVRAGAFERLLLAPHHIGLHIDHHLLASVPFFNLPRLHRLLLKSDYYRLHAHLNNGYFWGPKGSGRFADDLYGQTSTLLPL